MVTWSLEMFAKLNEFDDVFKVNFDFCMLDMETRTRDSKVPAKKRTSVLTNSHAVAALLREAQCRG